MKRQWTVIKVHDTEEHIYPINITVTAVFCFIDSDPSWKFYIVWFAKSIKRKLNNDVL